MFKDPCHMNKSADVSKFQVNVKMCNTASVVAEERYTIGCRYKYGP
jgi:hypothetical protein